jgi:hypothetical protein
VSDDAGVVELLGLDGCRGVELLHAVDSDDCLFFGLFGGGERPLAVSAFLQRGFW